MRKSVLLMILLFAVGMTASAQKFALIDMEYILKNIPAYELSLIHILYGITLRQNSANHLILMLFYREKRAYYL